MVAVCDHEHGLCNHWDLLDCIAELEALAKERHDAAHAFLERAEKAEAEVERLRQLIRTHGPCGPNCLLLIHMEEGGGREETPGGGTSPSRAEKAEAEVEWWHARDPEGWAFYKGCGGRESGASDRSGEGGSQLPGSTTAHVSAANPAAPRKERVP